MDNALEVIEDIQVIGYLAKELQNSYHIDYDDVLKTLRLVNSGFLGEARDFLEEIEVDVALVEDATRLSELYGRYQRIHEDKGLASQFLAEIVFDIHYNARAAIIRAVLGGERAEAETIVATVRAMPPRFD